MKNKLALLKEYVGIQANDLDFWYVPENATERFFQKELRRLTWLIEDATCEQIQSAINNYHGDHGCIYHD